MSISEGRACQLAPESIHHLLRQVPFPMSDSSKPADKLRSRAWFDNPDNIDMTALYLERYLHFGLSLEELRSGKPNNGIAQPGSDLSPCHRPHMVLAERRRGGLRGSGGLARG